MIKLTTDKEKKDYIKKRWNVTNGKTIAEMLKRYWKVDGSRVATPEDVEEIYNG